MATKKRKPEPKVEEHGVDGAVYALTPVGYQPTIICLCGEERTGETWEEAGGQFDDHLTEHPQQ